MSLPLKKRYQEIAITDRIISKIITNSNVVKIVQTLTLKVKDVYVTKNEILNGLFVQDVWCPVSETSNCAESNQQ